MEFNSKSRKYNAVLSSFMGIMQQILKVLVTFIYRTIFLSILSKEYLGINGLFSNIILLLSLAELGIGNVIIYRMYKPFAEKNVARIGAYIRFYKKVYLCAFCFVIVIGCGVYPFINRIIDSSEVSSNVNLRVIYALFVIQSAVSYLFVYKQSLLNADQKGYLTSGFNIFKDIVINFIQIISLLCTRKYECVLISGIVVSVAFNAAINIYIDIKYKEILKEKDKLSSFEKKQIFNDTKGVMCHKIGSTVVSGTDNIIISKYVNLISVGLYSNYATLISAFRNLLIGIFKSFVPSIGNYVQLHEKEDIYDLYRKLVFINLWISSATTVCLFVLLNHFIIIWLDESYLLNQMTVGILCIQYYIQTSSIINNAFIEGCGLFMKDRIRPLIESVLNLVISIIMVKRIGIAGVFIGTCLSSLSTFYWREPYLLFKNIFNISSRKFVLEQINWGVITLILAWIMFECVHSIKLNVITFLAESIVCFLTINCIYIIAMHKKDEFMYLKSFILHFIRKYENTK